MKPALEDAGFRCIEAADDWTALGLVDTETPDLEVLFEPVSSSPGDAASAQGAT